MKDLLKIVEKFGIYFDEVGLNKTYGRLFGLFMTAIQPISMKKLVEDLGISKSTASIELRRLLTMGVIEKVLLPGERADFYQLKKNIWAFHLNQKIQDIKNLRMIIEEIPSHRLEDLTHLQDMASYCTFIENELEALTQKYRDLQLEKNKRNMRDAGSYLEQGKDNQNFILNWFKFSALSEEFADKMAALTSLGVNCFKQVELDFLSAYPQAMEEDKSLTIFKGLNHFEWETLMEDKLNKVFSSRPKDVSNELRAWMAHQDYYLVTIQEEKSEKVLGFMTFLSGGSIPKNEYKITVLAIDPSVRRTGLASLLINALNKIGVESKKLLVSTRPTNKAAINAYKKWGFIEDQEMYKNSSSHFIQNHWIHLARHD